jgi:hypothetical protein
MYNCIRSGGQGVKLREVLVREDQILGALSDLIVILCTCISNTQ